MTEHQDDEGVPIGDWLEGFDGLPRDLKSDVLSRAIRTDPTFVTDVIFQGAPDRASRARALPELERMVARDQALEAYNLLYTKSGEPLWPRNLGDVAAQLAAGTLERPEPIVGGLLYPGRVNAVYGTHTAGKTWLSLHLARVNAEQGGRTLIVDWEDSEVGLAYRCSVLGPGLAKTIEYVSPDGAIQAEQLADVVASRGVTLVVLDSVGESMAAGGLDSNVERDVTQWFATVPDALAEMGPAVLVIDHIAKKQDGTPSPVGSFRKSAAITGAQFALENKVGFSQSQSGWSQLTCTKDRNGHFATGEVVGRVDFEATEDGMRLTFKPGEAEVRATMDRMGAAILAFVDQRMEEVHGKTDENGDVMDGRPGITAIREQVRAMGVRGTNERFSAAVGELVGSGHLAGVLLAYGKTTRTVYVPASGGFDSEPLIEDLI